MTTFIALLRAINVGGNNKIAMADLKLMALAKGLTDPRTLLQSGNLVFASKETDALALEKLLEKETASRFGFEVDYLVRTASQWKQMIAKNPFSAEAKEDPSHLLVVFLKSTPTAKQVQDLKEAIPGRETIELVGSHLFVVYPDGIGRSKLTSALIEKKLGTRGTARNWNTIGKLKEMAGE